MPESRMPRLRTTLGIFPAILILCSLTSSCLFHKTSAAFTPPPPRPKTKLAAAPTLPAPPAIAGDPDATIPPAAPYSIPDEPAPPASRSSRRSAGATPPRQAPPPTPPEQAAPPKLGPIITADQRREYTRALDESLESVKRMMDVLATKYLNPEQSEIRVRIGTYQKQAEQERDQDLALAVNLAKRAQLLAQDLLERVP